MGQEQSSSSGTGIDMGEMLLRALQEEHASAAGDGVLRFKDSVPSIDCDGTDTIAICMNPVPGTVTLQSTVALPCAASEGRSFSVRVLHAGTETAEDSEVIVGLVGADTQHDARTRALGARDLGRSVGVTQSGRVLRGGVCVGRLARGFGSNDVVTLRVEECTVRVEINGEAMEVSPVGDSCVSGLVATEGQYRFAVSLQSEQQAVKLGSAAICDADRTFLRAKCLDLENPGAVRFEGSMRTIKSSPNGQVICCVATMCPATSFVPSRRFGEGAEQSITLRILSLSDALHVVVGIMGSNIRGHGRQLVGQLPGSVGISEKGEAVLPSGQSGLQQCTIEGGSYGAGDTVTITVDGSGRLRYAVNGAEKVLPAALGALRVCGAYRFGVSLLERGQAVRIGAQELNEEEEGFLRGHEIAVGVPMREATAAAAASPSTTGAVPASSAAAAPAGAAPRLAGGDDVAVKALELSGGAVELGELLGQGPTGAWVSGTWDGVGVAVKRHRVKRLVDRDVVLRRMLSSRAAPHPSVGAVLGWFQPDAETLCVVAPVFDAGARSLREVLRERGGEVAQPAAGGPLGWSGFFRVARGIVRALAHLHGRGVVHGNLKSTNVMLKCGGDEPVLVDFGRVVSAAAVGGTLGCAAPEQVLRDEHVAATDAYAFGCVAWEMLHAPLTPRGEFESDAKAMAAVAAGKLLAMDGVPDDLRGVLEGCLGKRPADRPSAASLLLRLNESAAARGV